MWLGLGKSEWGLGAFIFAIVYAAGFVGRFGEFVGRSLARGEKRP